MTNYSAGKKHFLRVLNGNDQETKANITSAEELLHIETGPPNVEEVKSAIKALKGGKAPGTDQVHPETLKVDKHLTATALTEVLANIWISEETPHSWKTGLIGRKGRSVRL